MHLKKLVSNYSSFNEWANSRMVKWLGNLEKDLLYKQSPSSFTSLDYTLQHILRAQKFWLKFITEQDISQFNWTVREGEVDLILSETLEISTQMKQLFSAFSVAELERELNLNMPWAKNNLSRYEYIIHVVNHSSFHRGQLVTIARTIGIADDIPNTDYNIFNCH